MSVAEAGAAPPATAGGWQKALWHWRHDPKLELWLALSSMILFYNVYAIVFFLVTDAQPPPDPAWEIPRVGQWFDDNRRGLPLGFGVIFIAVFLTAACNALIAYSMRRMSVSPAFAYAYFTIYSFSAIPGMLLTCIALVVGAMRPDRDPELLHWLYDLAFMAFDGTMGVFLIGTTIWMIAILIDKNRVFPKWFAYLNLCNAMTEVVVAPAWLFTDGVFAWDGEITWWLDMVVFVVYTGCFITLLRNMILREDFGDGPLPA